MVFKSTKARVAGLPPPPHCQTAGTGRDVTESFRQVKWRGSEPPTHNLIQHLCCRLHQPALCSLKSNLPSRAGSLSHWILYYVHGASLVIYVIVIKYKIDVELQRKYLLKVPRAQKGVENVNLRTYVVEAVHMYGQ